MRLHLVGNEIENKGRLRKGLLSIPCGAHILTESSRYKGCVLVKAQSVC